MGSGTSYSRVYEDDLIDRLMANLVKALRRKQYAQGAKISGELQTACQDLALVNKLDAL